MAFDRFDGKEWHPISQPRKMSLAVPLPQAASPDQAREPKALSFSYRRPNNRTEPNLYFVAENARPSFLVKNEAKRVLTVQASSELARTFVFLPPRAEWLETSTVVKLDANRVARIPAGYAAYYSVYSMLGGNSDIAPPQELYTEEEWAEWRKVQLQVPHLDEQVHELARRLFEGCNSVYEKRVAVMRFLRTHFTYSYFFFTPEGKNSLSYFLLERKAAHCEYFATAAALLLRLGGVRTRYVTGFSFPETGGGNTRVFRNRSAHAWVEAWDPDSGWVTVEATPSIRRLKPPDRLDYWLARAEFWLMRVRDFYEEFGLSGILFLPLVFTWQLLTSQSLAAQIMKLIVLAAGVLWLVRRFKPSVNNAEDEVGRALLALLRRMDRTMKKHGLIRLPNQTLMQFAEAVKNIEALTPEMKEESATWYQEFARVRFAGGATPEDVERLGRP
jgi:transglutaminase-like putative cysteine protease